jgi:hypothetical protein
MEIASSVPKFASAAEVATALGITKNALDRQRCVNPKGGPPFVKIGARVFYPVSGFTTWLDAKLQGGAAHG